MSYLKKKTVKLLNETKVGIIKLKEIRAEKGSAAFFNSLYFGIRYELFDKSAIDRLKRIPPALVPNRIVFETNDDFTDNGRALFDYMIEHHYQDKYEIIWLVNNPELYMDYCGPNVKFVRKFVPGFERRTPEAFYYAMSAAFIFYTQGFNWIKAAKMDQVFFDLWHGCGYKANKGGRKVFFDYVLVPGELFIKTKKEFFQCSEKKILPIGYPRYDKMLRGSDAAEALCKRLLKDTDSDRMVLWMPTYRHATSVRLNEETLNNAYNIPIISGAGSLHAVDRFCREKQILLIIKSHYLQIPYDFGNEPLTNIIYLTNQDLTASGVQLYEFIHYSDALLSDYSSVSIDYLLLDKPLGFTLDDYEQYTESRGWVFENPLDYMPGAHIYNEEDMLSFLSDVRENRDMYREERARVRSLAHNPCDNYCKRVLDFLGI